MSFRSWGPKENLVYALSVGSSQVDATKPTGFAVSANQFMVYNSGSTDVLVYAYKYNGTANPTLTFPTSGSPPTGRTGTIVPAGKRILVSGPTDADSFSAIGSGAGPSIIYVQRGDGST